MFEGMLMFEQEEITEIKIVDTVSFTKPSAERSIYDGIQKIWCFKNNFGASVIHHRGSYGYKEGLWELAVLYFEIGKDDFKYSIVYDTPITDDVLGYLNETQVEEILEKIKNLKEE